VQVIKKQAEKFFEKLSNHELSIHELLRERYMETQKELLELIIKTYKGVNDWEVVEKVERQIPVLRQKKIGLGFLMRVVRAQKYSKISPNL